VTAQPGIRIHRVRSFAAMLDGRRQPALLPEDDALCMVHEAADERAVIAILADVAAAGVSGQRLRRALDRHPSLRRRRFVAGLIEDVVAGTRDAERDLDDLAAGRAVARLRWQQVYGGQCRTAARIAQALRARGWAGEPRPCGPTCELRRR
jgi:hypothetical protein